ncbi:MAG: hypothetical protein QOD57_4716 [Actinomycetota bacterium]|jgi:hypothetical protein|nr:hypothetical protein [Actinomycetota bacterium]
MTGPMTARANAYAVIVPTLWRMPATGERIAEPVSEILWMNSMVARGPARLPINLA